MCTTQVCTRNASRRGRGVPPHENTRVDSAPCDFHLALQASWRKQRGNSVCVCKITEEEQSRNRVDGRSSQGSSAKLYGLTSGATPKVSSKPFMHASSVALADMAPMQRVIYVSGLWRTAARVGVQGFPVHTGWRYPFRA